MSSPSRRRTLDPRMVAVLALLLSATAIALEIVYTIGQFVLRTFDRVI